MYLLDTDICIDFVDGRSEIARQRVSDNFRAGICVSAITAAELLVGPRESTDPEADREKAEQFLSIVTTMDFDHLAAENYVALVQRIGVNRRSFDRLIAAHALALGAVLVTNNEKHFADVPGLMVENWTI